MHFILNLLRCSSIEDCRRIQKGHLAFRRIGKWSVLFSIAFAFLINDAFSILIAKAIAKYNNEVVAFNEVTNSVIYKWTAGWLMPPLEAPEFPHEIIFLYNVINGIQFIFFIFTIGYILWWTYADCRVQGGITFSRLMKRAMMTNIAIYIPGRFLLAFFLHG